MDVSEIAVSVVNWIGVAEDSYRWRAPLKAIMKLRFQ
jgi:hypothetical protein